VIVAVGIIPSNAQGVAKFTFDEKSDTVYIIWNNLIALSSMEKQNDRTRQGLKNG
jgi:hypothetical protein